MDFAENIREQHSELLKGMEALSRPWRIEAAPVARSLSRLSGMLSIHLDTEARSIYPALAVDKDPRVRATAEDFHNGMRQTLAAFGDYRQKWSRPETIEADTIRFMQETRHIFYSISKMIEREDRELYTLLKKAA
ncbi:MAG TPA: hemerythrin domain-containing protein [Thermodesulfobacteriota bacterium]